MKSKLVTIENFEVCYPGGFVGFSGISFALGRGEILGVVGESGSGKSTLIRTLINLPSSGAQVTAGSFYFDGQDTAAMTEKQWRRLRGGRIAMIFQNPGASLNPVLSVERQFIESIRFHRKMSRGEARQLALEELAKMSLADPEAVLTSRPWQLSGGMKQRVAIAISLAMNPDLILADEPTSALDVVTQAVITEEFARRRRELGTSIIMVSHNISACARISSRLLVMKDGRQECFDGTAEVMASEPQSYTGELVVAIPRLSGERDELG